MKRLLLAFLGLFALHAQAAEQLIVYNWADYLPKEVLTRFTKETGIKVKYSTYDTNEVMYAKVKTLGGAGYDIVRALHLLRRPHASRGAARGARQVQAPEPQEPRSEGLEPALRPGQCYSVPYLWGSTASRCGPTARATRRTSRAGPTCGSPSSSGSFC